MERRKLLTIMAVGAAAPVLRGQSSAPTAAELKFFKPSQKRLIDRLSEMIIPADEHSGGAGEAKVSLFIDDLVADLNEEEQTAWTSGLAAVDSEAKKRFSKDFLDCSADQQDQIMADMAANEKNPQNELQKFFTRIKTQTISGYYTTRLGLLEELEYKGVMPIAEFEPCTHPEHMRKA